MKNITKLLLSLSGVAAIVLQSAAVQAQIAHLLIQHPGLSGLGGVLLLAGSLLHDPKEGSK